MRDNTSLTLREKSERNRDSEIATATATHPSTSPCGQTLLSYLPALHQSLNANPRYPATSLAVVGLPISISEISAPRPHIHAPSEAASKPSIPPPISAPITPESRSPCPPFDIAGVPVEFIRNAFPRCPTIVRAPLSSN
ncbi:MAG: hypothetical protein ABJN80_14140, partial [Luteolibacter sp.]